MSQAVERRWWCPRVRRGDRPHDEVVDVTALPQRLNFAGMTSKLDHGDAVSVPALQRSDDLGFVVYGKRHCAVLIVVVQ